MLKNSQMLGNRFAEWSRYRLAARKIRDLVDKGHAVILQNHGAARAVRITARNAHVVTARRDGLFIQNGKQRFCVMDRAVTCIIRPQ